MKRLALGLLLSGLVTSAQAGDRPPQYILLSFDGSYNIGVWQKIRGFTLAQKQKKKDVRFTFFASGVYFVAPADKSIYQGPKHAPGKSDIGFGDSRDDIALRIDEVNKAFQEGHEIGSHGNGHFDGGTWSHAEWMSEFQQFEKLIFDVFSLAKIDPNRKVANGWLMNKSDIKGFRAPLLATSAGLWTTLKDMSFTYDCSKTDTTEYWPQKSAQGLWNFPLAMLKIAGTGKKTLSMDYNFYVAQSNGAADAGNKQLYADQTYNTYMAWFQKNYSGTRAPINIGHHFSAWNGGAYYEALTRFADMVCGLPEVKCVTYTEYVQWLESLNPQVLAGFHAGQFTKAPAPQLGFLPPPLDIDVAVVLRSDAAGEAVLTAAVSTAQKIKGLKAFLSLDGKKIDQDQVKLSAVKSQTIQNQVSVTAHVLNSKGVEVARSTQILHGLMTSAPALSPDPQELRALQGDLPAAHMDERN